MHGALHFVVLHVARSTQERDVLGDVVVRVFVSVVPYLRLRSTMLADLTCDRKAAHRSRVA